MDIKQTNKEEKKVNGTGKLFTTTRKYPKRHRHTTQTNLNPLLKKGDHQLR